MAVPFWLLWQRYGASRSVGVLIFHQVRERRTAIDDLGIVMTQVPFSQEFPDSQTAIPQQDVTADSDRLDLLTPSTPSAKMPKRISNLQGRRLSQLLLLTVLPLTIFPLLLESLVAFGLTQRRTRADFDNQLANQALLTSEDIRKVLDDEFAAMDVLALSPSITTQVLRGAAQAEADSLQNVSIETLENDFSETRLLSPSPAVNTFLARAAEAQGFSEIIITEENGFTVGYSNPTSDFVQSDEAWWQQGQSQWIGPPVLDESTNVYGVELSQAIQAPDNGEFLGVMKVLIDALEFDELTDLLRSTGLVGSQQVQIIDTQTSAVFAIFNPDGETVYSNSDETLTIIGEETVAGLATRLVEAKQGGELGSAEIGSLQQQLQSSFPINRLDVSISDRGDSAQERQTLVATFTYQGREYVIATIPGVRWVATASMDLSEIQAAGRNELLLLIILALALAGVAAVLTIALSRQLSAPIDDLSTIAQQVAKGNLDAKATPRGSLETRTLADTFNGLVGRLRGFLQEQANSARWANLSAEVAGSSAATATDLVPVYNLLVAQAREILQTDRTVIYQFNPDWSGAIVAESVEANLPSAYEQQLGDPCIPQETLEKYQSEGVLLESNVATAGLHPEHMALLNALKVKSILGVPIINQGKLYGLLITHHCHKIHDWTPAEVNAFRDVAFQMGRVIERQELLEQTRELAAEQQQIKEGLQRSALQLLMDVDPISQGDLTVRAQVTEDEIGTVADSYNATIRSLRKIVVQVQEAAKQVVDTTDTNQPLIQSLSVSASRQAEEILTTLERVQEMSASVQQVSNNAEKAEAAVRQAEATVAEGDDAMNRTVEGIVAIRETVADTAKKVKRLGESSQKISNVVNLISGFAAQTNMLALNASIEASRAGESGKGFAVVAEEVRELARQSAEATTEIEKLVSNIQAETNAVVTAMEAGTEQVVVGTQLVDETRQSLNQITYVSRQISDLVASITEATVEQSQTSEMVTNTMTSVADNASQNSNSATQVSDSFEQLLSVAQALQDEVGRFKMS